MARYGDASSPEDIMIRFIIQAVVTMIGLWLSAQVVPGVAFTNNGSLIAAALILGLVNAVVRPFMVIITFPITVVTLGLFLLVVNAAMIGLTAMFLGGFTVNGLWAGIGAAIVTGVVSWIAGAFIGDEEKRG
ncbi:putative membrane protein [Brevundimonas aurantiaca]|jgi:putative membrane protein|uniref:Putative membrane protein n=2 Tax=Caulobacteraceae TaxID=76892 RepID=A0A7W9C7J2_9CAUL|nr:putative membrane protein [Brevundimonas aurantiaca]